jgi:hypothetical protein
MNTRRRALTALAAAAICIILAVFLLLTAIATAGRTPHPAARLPSPAPYTGALPGR